MLLVFKIQVDHCDLSSDTDHDKDYYDGLIDITHGIDYVTVSNTKLYDHWKGSLVGHSDNNIAEDKDHLTVSYYHNCFVFRFIMWISIKSIVTRPKAEE